MTSQSPHINRWRAFALLAVAFFMAVVDLTIVNVSLPTIGRDLHFSETNSMATVALLPCCRSRSDDAADRARTGACSSSNAGAQESAADALARVTLGGLWTTPAGAGAACQGESVANSSDGPDSVAGCGRSWPRHGPRSGPAWPLPAPGFSTEAVQVPARVNVTCVTPLGEEVASTS
jgi:hypothetical protein